MKERFKKYLWAYIRFVQKILITVLLFLTYVFGLGLLRILASVFARSLLRTQWPDGGKDTFWLQPRPDEYAPEPDECRRQS